jgi:hypothetical protein
LKEKVPAQQGDEVLEVAVGGSTLWCLITTISPSSVGSADSFSLREKRARKSLILPAEIERSRSSGYRVNER